MKKIFTGGILFLAMSLFTIHTSIGQHALSVGPMIHFNIGGGKMKPSYCFEVAYWNYAHFPYSVDLGFEFEKSKFRIYSEGQTGVLLAGVSAGPVLEFKRNSPVQLGFQGSFWANYYVGFNCRFRMLKDYKCFAPGIYAKLPFSIGPNENKGSGSDSDWDWD